MKHRLTRTTILNGFSILLLALLLMWPLVGTASAQDESAAPARVGEDARAMSQTPQGDALRRRIRDRIETEPGLQTQEREQLRRHLGECEKLGLDDAAVGAIFSESGPLQKQIRVQERVLAMAREGLPVDPVTQKLQEGRRKGVSEEVLERVCARMEEDVRAANRYMQRAREAGVTPGDRDAERRCTADVAKQMFEGLGEGDLDQIRDRARLRLRDGSCTTEDLAATAEAIVTLHAMGVEGERAARVAGDALQYGYSPREMRQFSWMIMTAKTHGGPQNAVLDVIERGIRNQLQINEMVREMYRYGWMGPAEERGGHGGQDPMGGAGGRRGGGGGGASGEKTGRDGTGGGGHGNG
jgi:hypothetical protein